ncbi:hypothetical protein AMIS_20360 [Actinoplanes missouriensis 431]|uniref:DUF5753 domain-containing protein n=1 Tax=Actinoplanes missouriensis (strain ATCC 14538 / DSM 43046 / CBS 188.64 / JCM 3121 / NBRC 102363 / NCIMB 12654 / NRRL B-3342 / UNCC 431) TaxID=512565 RepID=I0H2L9_ACTM4|nr:Scr1 family TA system antitoxin-like transcriptional regulator [Actinoplanes missouriensis]BAL87256.1 hypothetical protein AMIS_20360 [Actinoplanes missouriensis 431]
MNNPDLQQWLLAPDGIATRLRALRGNTRGTVIAEAAGMRTSKLSKLELAQQEPTADDIRAIVAAAGQPKRVADELVAKLAEKPQVRSSARVSRFGQAASQQRLNALLAKSSHVRLFDATYLPRPMQIPEYAAAVLEAAGRLRGITDSPTQAAAALAASSQYLYEPSRTFEIVIAEPALQWAVLPVAGMRIQLERVLDLARLPNVDLRVLPLRQPGIVPPPYGFGLVDGAGYTDGLEGLDDLADVRLAGHIEAMGRLAEASAAGKEASNLIREALRRLAA